MQALPMETEIMTNVFKYFQEDNKSTSTLQEAGGNQVIIPLNNMLISANTTLYLPVVNNANIAAVGAQGANTVLSRQFYVGDKRFLSNVQRIFNSVQFTSNEVTMQTCQNTDIVNNLLYYKNNKRNLSQSQILGYLNVSLQTYLDPLVTHDVYNKGFVAADLTRQADDLYVQAANTNLAQINAGTFLTFLPISFKTLLPGLFDLQETIYVTNASLTLNFTQTPLILGFQISQAISDNAATTNKNHVITQVPFKLLNNSQAFVQSVNNFQNFEMYRPSSQMQIQEKLWDLQSISQEIIFNSCKFFAFIVIPPQADIANLRPGRDLFQLSNTDIYINTIQIGDSILYQQKNNSAFSLQTQKRALESIMGTEIQVPHLAFFSFDDVQGQQKIKIDIVSGTITGFKVLVYTISEGPAFVSDL